MTPLPAPAPATEYRDIWPLGQVPLPPRGYELDVHYDPLLGIAIGYEWVPTKELDDMAQVDVEGRNGTQH